MTVEEIAVSTVHFLEDLTSVSYV